MSKREIRDLFISWLTISIAFALILSRGFFNIGLQTWLILPTAFIGVGTGFVFHELAHRQVARHFGAHAEFRMWKFGLVLALASGIISFISSFGFIFAAPGAVYIYGQNIDLKQNGLISLAGAATNISIGILFAIIGLLSNHIEIGIVAGSVAMINFFLALFNLLPVPPLDGSKVFRWNPLIWAIFFVPLLLIII